MQDILLVVDMQKDFVDGSLATPEAQAIVDRMVDKVKAFEGPILFTQDTHGPDYLETQEGRLLPVEHCIKGTPGWEIIPQLTALGSWPVLEKDTFGSKDLVKVLLAMNEEESIRSITLAGLCTDICVISNALLIKAYLPEVEIRVDPSCSAGVTPQSHETALEAMRACQITILGDDQP